MTNWPIIVSKAAEVIPFIDAEIGTISSNRPISDQQNDQLTELTIMKSNLMDHIAKIMHLYDPNYEIPVKEYKHEEEGE